MVAETHYAVQVDVHIAGVHGAVPEAGLVQRSQPAQDPHAYGYRAPRAHASRLEKRAERDAVPEPGDHPQLAVLVHRPEHVQQIRMVNLGHLLETFKEGCAILTHRGQAFHGDAGSVRQPGTPGAAMGAPAKKLFQLQWRERPCDRIRGPN
jgi:hypothetical protein